MSLKAYAVFAALLALATLATAGDVSRIYRRTSVDLGESITEADVTSPRFFLRQENPTVPSITGYNPSGNNSVMTVDDDKHPMFARTDDNSIVRSDLDDRKYSRFELKNGLEVLLISDPETTKAAASVDVGVGYFHDPEEVAGLAHFLEHMLFLGSKKYPKENAFESFIQRHGGSNNAYTSMENTNFHFDILPNDLEGALDLFAQFFIDPKLSINGTQREMNAVNSEHRKNIENDGWRSTQLKRHVASKNTPYSKFGTGSSDTLGKHTPQVLQTHLRSLWEKFYTARNMRLVVLGAQPLPTLARMVNQTFGAVRETPHDGPKYARNIAFEDRSATVYDPKMKQSIVYYAPVRRIRTMTMQWAIPSQMLHYESNAGAYIAHLIESDGDGSVLSHLRRRGWVTAIQAGVGVTTSAFSLFQVEIKVTERGMKYATEIAESIFQALHAISTRGIARWRFNEQARLAKIHFMWKGKENPEAFVSDVSARMRWFKKEHWISGDNLFYQYDPKPIQKMLEALSVDNVVIFQAAQDYATSKQLASVEPHYNIKYTVEPVADLALTIWRRDTARPFMFGENRKSNILRLPEPNEWVPTPETLAIKPFYDMSSHSFMTAVNPNATIHIAAPRIVFEQERPGVRVWFRQDAKFKRPIVHANIRIWISGLESSPRAVALTLMYTRLVQDILQDWAFAASQGGYDYGISTDAEGITVKVMGYAEHMESYIESILYRMSAKGFRAKEDRFDVLREHALESMANTRFLAPYKYARNLMRIALGGAQPIAEIAAALNAITVADVRGWPTAIYSDARMEVFFNGNIYPWEGITIAKTASKTLDYKTMSASFKEAHRMVQSWKTRRPLLDGRYTLNTPSLDPHEPNSMVSALYQYGAGKDIDRLYMSILAHYIRKPAYNQLRTKEQLGYIVWATGSAAGDVPELSIQVQSSSYDPVYVDRRIQTFLRNFRQELRSKLDTETFTSHVMNLYETKLTNSTSITEDTNDCWAAILSQRYNFLQRFVDAQILLKQVTLGGFLKFVDKTLGFGKYSGHSLTLQIYSHAHNASQASLKQAPAEFHPHAELPAPLPKSEYTDKLRQVASTRLHENLRREGTLSEYLRRSRKFRNSETGRAVLKELLKRDEDRRLRDRNVLQHLEWQSYQKLSRTFAFQTYEANCTKECANESFGDNRMRCMGKCVVQKMITARETIINGTLSECNAACVNKTINPSWNVTIQQQCQSNCTRAQNFSLWNLRDPAQRQRYLADYPEAVRVNGSTHYPAANTRPLDTTLPMPYFLESAVASSLNDPATAIFQASFDLNGPIVSDESNPGAVRDAAFALGKNKFVHAARMVDLSTASFLETDVSITESTEVDEEDMEAEELDQVEAEQSLAESSVESSVDAEMHAASQLRDKTALLNALEKEAFEAALALREEAEAKFNSLAEADNEAVPSQVGKEESEAALKKIGLHKFEEVKDVKEEMEDFGIPKADIAAIEARVGQRYQNISEIAPRSFYYEGADTDVPVKVTIQYSPITNVTRQMSVTTLNSLKHSMYLAPLNVRTDVPPLIAVPMRAPNNIPTVAYGYP